MIFGLKTSDDNNENKVEIKKLLTKIGAKFNENEIKINRFKKTNETSIPPVQVVLKSKEEKLKALLKHRKILKISKSTAECT